MFCARAQSTNLSELLRQPTHPHFHPSGCQLKSDMECSGYCKVWPSVQDPNRADLHRCVPLLTGRNVTDDCLQPREATLNGWGIGHEVGELRLPVTLDPGKDLFIEKILRARVGYPARHGFAWEYSLLKAYNNIVILPMCGTLSTTNRRLANARLRNSLVMVQFEIKGH